MDRMAHKSEQTIDRTDWSEHKASKSSIRWIDRNMEASKQSIRWIDWNTKQANNGSDGWMDPNRQSKQAIDQMDRLEHKASKQWIKWMDGSKPDRASKQLIRT
jgi:hypothetical protein